MPRLDSPGFWGAGLERIERKDARAIARLLIEKDKSARPLIAICSDSVERSQIQARTVVIYLHNPGRVASKASLAVT